MSKTSFSIGRRDRRKRVLDIVSERTRANEVSLVARSCDVRKSPPAKLAKLTYLKTLIFEFEIAMFVVARRTPLMRVTKSLLPTGNRWQVTKCF